MTVFLYFVNKSDIDEILKRGADRTQQELGEIDEMMKN